MSDFEDYTPQGDPEPAPVEAEPKPKPKPKAKRRATSRKAASSATPAALRAAVQKALDLAAADDELRGIVAAVVGEDDIVEMAVTIQTKFEDTASPSLHTILDAPSELEAGIAAMELGDAGVKDAWTLADHLGAELGAQPSSLAQAALSLVRGVTDHADTIRGRLDDVATLTSRA